jgi:hypothetical protein
MILFCATFGKDSKSTALGLLKKFLSKSACQIVFVRGLRDPVLEFQFVLPLCVILLCFATQSSRKKQGRRAHGCAACVCHASLHSGGAHSCAACVSLFVSLFRQQDSKTRAAVLLTRALDRWLLVTSHLFARVEKMLRPKRA